MRPTLGHRARQILPYLIIVIMAFAIIWLPMVRHVYVSGADTAFHMNATYDTAQQIKTGHYSYFLTMFGFGRSARIVNALYGPLGNYFSGLVLLLFGTWLRWEMTLSLIVLITAGFAMYHLTRYWAVDRIVSCLVSLLYMFSTPLMEFMWGQQYDGVGAALIPVIVLFGSQMLQQGRFNWLGLAITMMILAEVHLFSVILGTLALIPCFIAAVVRHYKDVIKLVNQSLKALFLTLLLTFNVWGALIEVLGSNQNLVPIYPNDHFNKTMQGVIGYLPHARLSQNLSLLGLSFTVLTVLIIILYLFNCRRLNFSLNYMAIILGFGFLWMSTEWFPWTGLQKQYPALNINLQFPRRFLPVSFTVLLLILGVIVSRMRFPVLQLRWPKEYLVAVAILTLFVGHSLITNDYSAKMNEQRYRSRSVMMFSVGMFWRTQPNPNQLRASLTGPHYDRFMRLIAKPTPDYMPSSQHIKPNDASYLQWHPYGLNIHQIYRYQGRKTYQALPHRAFQVNFWRPEAGVVTLPIVKYAHTSVWLNGRQLIKPKITPIGAMQVKLHRGKNVLKLQYQPATWFKIGMLISILGWLWFIWSMIRIHMVRHKLV